MVINGKKIAEQVIEDLKKELKPKKFLAAILVGDDPASISFLKQKEKIAKELSIDFRLYKYPASIKNDELRKEVLKTAEAKTCGGVIIQLPLPKHINKHVCLNVVPREKDVDVLGERALGAFYTGRNPIFPPAIGTTKKILQTMNQELQDKRVVVIGKGPLIGKPISVWLMDGVSELTVLDKSAKDLQDKLKDADIIISGVGKVNLFDSLNLKEGALVIDFGYDITNSGIAGDFNLLEIQNSKFKINYTPTPGGTGPILVAQLFENFYKLAELQSK
ncbi:MAG: bifunctional 5,10-methylenetetrahydrofolate dehydrogenase/5,10-methenyltetrahydrofolate cyclohydrolase [Patescibacteria group bacterium]|nr:bifunctional 5,10-methylenetetrahydrofolate dehydrogenase/5,10-methenyltetrahydrofolate cyclohydrolase [Patescibacteria group bacterium]